MLARGDERTSVRCFFPKLYVSGLRTNQHMFLSQAKLIEWYEKGVRPALLDFLPECAGDFPPTYNAEMFRAQTSRKALSLTTKPLPSWGADEFATSIRYHLTTNHVDWAQDMIFQIQVRGLKTATGHACNHVSAAQALDVFLENFRLGHLDQVFVDVGLEFSAARRALLWRTDSHFHWMNFLFPEQDVAFINGIIDPANPHYLRDLSSHVLDLSGCRSVSIFSSPFHC